MSFKESTKVNTGGFWLMMSPMISLTLTQFHFLFQISFFIRDPRLSLKFHLKSLMLGLTGSFRSERAVKKKFWL